ncbi:leucine-rich repeat domain-containing protein [Dysgonomonas macrotermitis]|nr:leucine-rich repeat domain-containing protein [Dysgonomonas macrotermitis]
MSISLTQAQVARTVDVTTPGTLGSLLGDDLSKVTDLIITGTINAADFTSMKSMTALKVLDMGGATIDNGMIPASAFQGRRVDKIILPESLITIGSYAFKNIQSPSLDFSRCNQLTTIDAYAFQSSSIISGIDLSYCSSLTTIGSLAFEYVTSHVILPDNMINLSNGSFQGFCGTVDLPAKLETIGSNAFQGAKLPEGLSLPASLKSLGNQAFKNIQSPSLDFSRCNQLTTINAYTFQSSSIISGIDLSYCSSLTTIGSLAFEYVTSHVILPDNMINLSNGSFQGFCGTVDLPAKLVTIGNDVFRDAKVLSINLPQLVDNIGNYAFYNCTLLTSLTSLNPTPPTLGTDVFYGVNKTACTLYVPKESISLYSATAQWKDFLSIQQEIKPIPQTIKLYYTEDGGTTILDEYQGVRIGEYYWMDSNFRNPTDIDVTKSQIDYAHDTYGMFDKQSTAPDSRTYWDYLGAQMGITNPSESDITTKLLPEFQKYYGTYYTMNRDRINKLSYVRRFGSLKEVVNNELRGEDVITHYWDGIRSIVQSKYWDLPTAADILQLIAMCGHGTMPEVRQFLSYKENEVPVSFVAPGFDWFYPNAANFGTSTYPSDTFDPTNTNKYGMNIVPGGFRWGVTQSSLRVKTEQGFTTLYNVPADELVGAGLDQALALPIIDKNKDAMNIESRIFTSFQLGDHPVISYGEYASSDAIPMRWCRALTDEELGYKLYINQNMTGENYAASPMVIYAAMIGFQYTNRERSGEEVLLEKVRNGVINKDDISIIKLGLDEVAPEGYVELPRGYIRGFYVQYILDNASPRKTLSDIIDIALINPSVWIKQVSSAATSDENVEARTLVQDANEATSISIYPNPVTDVLYINSGSQIDAVNIYTVNGQLVLAQKHIGSSVDVSHLSSGVYVLKVLSNGKESVHKIMKK